MRLTRSVSYAVGILLQVHAHSGGGSITAAKISKGSKFPPRFLYRVLRRLVDAGIMTGVSGPGGGYALARDAKKISLLEIVSAVEGPQAIAPLEPVNKKQKKAIDQINRLSQQHTKSFERSLAKLSLARLARG